jgi:hypothetical protein
MSNEHGSEAGFWTVTPALLVALGKMGGTSEGFDRGRWIFHPRTGQIDVGTSA